MRASYPHLSCMYMYIRTYVLGHLLLNSLIRRKLRKYICYHTQTHTHTHTPTLGNSRRSDKAEPASILPPSRAGSNTFPCVGSGAGAICKKISGGQKKKSSQQTPKKNIPLRKDKWECSFLFFSGCFFFFFLMMA